jgi:hypothetical protein
MSSLALQQDALLERLFLKQSQLATENIANYIDPSWERGLKVYESNAGAAAQSSLLAAYPVLAQLLGDESFALLARDFWFSHPPLRGELSHWGEALAEFVRHKTQLSETPYLSDVAELEWAMHRAQTAGNPEPDLASFALLTEQDPSELVLKLASGCAVLQSAWPVVSIVQAHLETQPDQTPDLTEAGQLLAQGVQESAVLWRRGFETRLRLNMPGEFDLLTAFLAGASLQQALDSSPTLDFNAWLTMAVQTGLLLGVSHRAVST